jgi:hypothetical protein
MRKIACQVTDCLPAQAHWVFQVELVGLLSKYTSMEN